AADIPMLGYRVPTNRSLNKTLRDVAKPDLWVSVGQVHCPFQSKFPAPARSRDVVTIGTPATPDPAVYIVLVGAGRVFRTGQSMSFGHDNRSEHVCSLVGADDPAEIVYQHFQRDEFQ